ARLRIVASKTFDRIASAKRLPFRHFLNPTNAASRAERAPRSGRDLPLPRSDTGASDGMIMKPEVSHRSRIEQIAPVKNDRRRHFLFHNRQVEICKLSPLGCNYQRLGAFYCFQCGGSKYGCLDGIDLAGFLHTFWIVNSYLRSFTKEIAYEVNCNR